MTEEEFPHACSSGPPHHPRASDQEDPGQPGGIRPGACGAHQPQDLITQQIDILEFLKPDMQKSGSASSTKDWNWLDYTHHRWTGLFGKRLVTLANQSGDPALRAYAYGWLSHVTADVVGHAYVNTSVGGPYRSHWQRHFVQEKFMDTWVWGFYHPGGIAMPASVNPGEIPFDYTTFNST